MSLQKPKRIECPEFLGWIRSLPCVVCGAPSGTAHHMISVGAGGSDLFAVPACPTCHRALQDRDWKTLHRRGIDVAYLWNIIALNLQKWLLQTGRLNAPQGP